MRYRAVAVSVVLTVAMAAGVVGAAPRHGGEVSDPTGAVDAHGWIDWHADELRADTGVDVGPPQTGWLPFHEFFEALLPETPRGETPSIEPPDEDDGRHLPDLAPLPAWAVMVDESIASTTVGDSALARLEGRDPFEGSRRALRFGVTIANRGLHSIEVVGVPEPQADGEERVRVNAMQCVRFAGPRVAGGGRACQEYAPVGSLSFHAQHGHFHFDGLARYRLLRDRGGRPDTSASGVVARSEKVGFCMGDTDWLGQEPILVDTGWYRECRHTTPHVPITFRQGISPSWGDSYGPSLAGQHLRIDGLADGFYWIEVAVNPGNAAGQPPLLETTRANNVSYRKVRLYADGTLVDELP